MGDPRFSSSRRRSLALLAGVPAALAMSRAVTAPEAMIERTIPATGEHLPVIGVGTWQTFDVGSSAAERAPLREVLTLLSEGGGKVIDSSPMYGASEAVVGELSAQLGLRPKLFVATKVWASGRAEGVRQMELSFNRLRVQKMDLMQIHNLVDVATHTRTLLDWEQQQRVRYLGITHYSASAYAEIERWLRTGAYSFLQINYSLAERGSERRLLGVARERGMAVIINRPFGAGAMFRRVRGKALPPWTAEIGAASWAQYFLKWILGHPAVTCAIPGTGNPAHMKDNLGAGYGALPDEALRKRMAEYFDAL